MELWWTTCAAGIPRAWKNHAVTAANLASGRDGEDLEHPRPGTIPLTSLDSAPAGKFLSCTGRCLLSLIHKPSEADIADQPQCQEIRPDTGPAGAHEGQRNPGN